MRALGILAIVVVSAALATVLWVNLPWVAANTTTINSAIAFLTILGSLAVFWSLIQTSEQFRASQKQAERESTERQIARLDALVLEVEVNEAVCAEILARPEYAEGNPVPEARFHTLVLQEALGLGTVTDVTTRKALWNAFRLMGVANSLMGRALDVMYMEHFTDPRDMLSREGRAKRTERLMTTATGHVAAVQRLLYTVRSSLVASRDRLADR